MLCCGWCCVVLCVVGVRCVCKLCLPVCVCVVCVILFFERLVVVMSSAELLFPFGLPCVLVEERTLWVSAMYTAHNSNKHKQKEKGGKERVTEGRAGFGNVCISHKSS